MGDLEVGDRPVGDLEIHLIAWRRLGAQVTSACGVESSVVDGERLFAHEPDNEPAIACDRAHSLLDAHDACTPSNSRNDHVVDPRTAHLHSPHSLHSLRESRGRRWHGLLVHSKDAPKRCVHEQGRQGPRQSARSRNARRLAPNGRRCGSRCGSREAIEERKPPRLEEVETALLAHAKRPAHLWGWRRRGEHMHARILWRRRSSASRPAHCEEGGLFFWHRRRASDERRVRREGEATAQQPAVAQAARELEPSQRTCMQRGRPSVAISVNHC